MTFGTLKILGFPEGGPGISNQRRAMPDNRFAEVDIFYCKSSASAG